MKPGRYISFLLLIYQYLSFNYIQVTECGFIWTKLKLGFSVYQREFFVLNVSQDMK